MRKQPKYIHERPGWPAITWNAQTLAAVLLEARFWQRLQHAPINARQREVLNRLLDGFEGNLTTSKYAKITKCSADTALRDMRELVVRNIIVQNDAGGRSTSYRLVDVREPGD